jgi:hypothetical protein
MAGEPIITASVITIPKTNPTITNRLFISKIQISQLKIDCKTIGRDMEEAFKGKITISKYVRNYISSGSAGRVRIICSSMYFTYDSSIFGIYFRNYTFRTKSK